MWTPSIRTKHAPGHSLHISDSKAAATWPRKYTKAITLRLTLFLPPNHGFGESFRGSGQAARMNFQSNASLEPARRLAETLDQCLGAVHFRQPGLDIPQPRQIRLACLVAQGQLGVLQFPK